MAGIVLRVVGADGFRRVAASAIVARQKRILAKRTADAVLAVATPMVPTDTEALVESGESIETDNGAAVVYRAPHAGYVHGPVDGSGRGGRAVPHWPPWGPGTALAGWAERHGIPAFLVARAISENGTPYVPFLADAKIEVMGSQYPGLAHEALQELRQALLSGEGGE